MNMLRVMRYGLLLVLCALMASCRAEQPRGQRYPLKGKVVSVDKDLRTASVAHEEIPGFMEAMTMSFIVKDDWAMGVLAPGQSISATLVVDGVDSWIEGVVIQEAPSPGSTPSPPAEPPPGVEVPDFKLRNQDGASIGLHGYRGRYLLLTFIYTRCPLPDYCPRMSANFARIHQSVLKEPALRGKAHLLTVSFDPAVDTPEVLTRYGRERAGDRGKETFSSWEFATGTPEEVKAITGYFGLTYYAEKDQIVHSLRTALIGPDGKLVKVYRGNEWTPEGVVGELRRLPVQSGR